MHRLSSVILLWGALLHCLSAQTTSPHGEELKLDCRECHVTNSWEIDLAYVTFNHDSLSFPLRGQHERTDCRACHASLILNEVENECASCHLDIHQLSLGSDCARCHNANSWIVDDVAGIHERISFPLIGVHAHTNCYDCHLSDTELRFVPIGTECFACHQKDFDNAKEPDHNAGDFSKDCTQCHGLNSFDWSSDDFSHSFFPLTKGHDIEDCARCHLSNDYTDISSDCISCHSEDYTGTTMPDHEDLNISTDCASCHTTDPEWNPARFEQHDNQFFPIYSGEHAGEWNDCLDCHPVLGDFQQFDCLGCHTNPGTDNKHDKVNGYVYQNQACLGCHPTGNKDEDFDHNEKFPLTGGHALTDCASCHITTYKGTPSECIACHQEDFDNSMSPNHTTLGLSTDCASCHTTTPGWEPASFDNHDDFYALNGAHANIALDCATCHNGDYNNTPNTCFGCHADDYNDALDPNHRAAGFPTDCAQCHSESEWDPATFDHDSRFPIYSGKHESKWDACIECHTTPDNFDLFSCTVCHLNPEMDDKHVLVNGYFYSDLACLACHPTGDADDDFNHDMTNFALTGAHRSVDCQLCHTAVFKGTPTDCFSCHEDNFEKTSNPDHVKLGLSTDCASCHTTDPEWNPAAFPNHDDYYRLEGAHIQIAMNCADCHNGDYNNTPDDCIGCHRSNYEGTVDPPHQNLMFDEDCTTCHTQSEWKPSTFDHDGEHFPINSGTHMDKWTECMDCHTNLTNYLEVSCINCHLNPEMDDKHILVFGYFYQNEACLACHPTGEAEKLFDHSETGFTLTGEHMTVECIDCHQGGMFKMTPTECVDCHSDAYNQTTNPDHIRLGINTDCATCHTTDPDWQPARFDIHDDYHPLNGAHRLIADQCVDCHNGDYNNTPSECVGCHLANYNATITPPHEQTGFGTDCAMCHTEDDWKPSTYDHDAIFPINSGTHVNAWNECVDCHINPMNYMEVSCIDCHEHNMDDTDEKHMGVNGYYYNSTACLICHPTGEKMEGIDHSSTNFPLTGAHLMVDCLDCHEQGFMGTPTECSACHQEHYNMTSNPDHTSLSIPMECEMCHTTDPGWKPATFDIHDSYYELTGAHQGIASECAQCHMGDYNNTPNMCEGCHMDAYNESMNPDHGALGLPNTCDNCHTTDPGWKPATFDIHDSYYPLTGAHLNIADECAKCHMGDYNNTPTTCDACHSDDYNSSTNPDHTVLSLPRDCDNCHTTEPGWEPATFDIHDNYYELTGGHLTIANECAKCHMGDYNNTPTTCDGCHIPDYDASTNPNHSALGLPTTCDDCHTTNPGWEPASFDIHDSYYPLTGAHVSIAMDCDKCHMGDYNNTPATCDGCHIGDYNTTTNPNHGTIGIPVNCDMCHTTDPGWIPADFPIHDSYYPLTGAHVPIAADCAVCHNGNYNNTPNTCDGCHINDYNSTTNPNHGGIGIPTDCDMCHTTDPNWNPATFPIHDNYYPLLGAHVSVTCFDCHMGDYNNTPTTCVGCHQADYDATTNPNHVSAGFPTTCESCHNENGWVPSTWDHEPYFPIYSGKHQNEWNQCLDCHTTPGNYKLFSCIDCHEHSDKTQVDEDHDKVSGYSYNSSACYTCHPTGEK